MTKTGAATRAARRRDALLAPDLVGHGGVQAYMRRLHVVLRAFAAEQGRAEPALWSLNDDPVAVRVSGVAHPDAPLLAARGDRIRFCAALLAGERIDHVVVGLLGLAPLAGVLRACGRVRGYTVVLHGVEAWRRVPWTQRLACRGARRIVATTRHTAHRFAQANGIDPRRIDVVPLCADESATSEAHVGPVLDGGFRVLCVGRQSAAERYKGFDELIVATRELADEGVPVVLHLIGDGDDQPRLRALSAAMGVTDRVRFHGGVPRATLQAAYAECDVFALPSRAEGFGIAFVEAMRHGRACVGARAGGIPEVLDEGRAGLLVDYGDPVGLADALRRLWRDPGQRRRLGEAGRSRASSHFGWPVFLERHLAALRGSIPARSAARAPS